MDIVPIVVAKAFCVSNPENDGHARAELVLPSGDKDGQVLGDDQYLLIEGSSCKLT